MNRILRNVPTEYQDMFSSLADGVISVADEISSVKSYVDDAESRVEELEETVTDLANTFSITTKELIEAELEAFADRIKQGLEPEFCKSPSAELGSVIVGLERIQEEVAKVSLGVNSLLRSLKGSPDAS
jgi:tetrahydromethanopterin S-methyltransferase subunit B